MSVYQHSRHVWPPRASSPARARAPTPPAPHFQVDQPAPRRWVRVGIFPRNTYARLRYVPLRPQAPGRPREQALTDNLWSCRTTFARSEVVRVKYSWELSWDYYEIKLAVPIIPGFGRSNAALHRLQQCPPFAGEVTVVRRTGPRLTLVADMRIEDRGKVEVAVTSIIRSAMGLDPTFRGNVLVESLISFEALDAL